MRRIEDAMDVAEAAKFPHALPQILQKALNLIIKSQILPETSFREWRSKPVPDKTWANFKKHFAKEVRNYKKDQGITAKSSYSVANADNQALLEAQNEFRNLTQSFINEFRNSTSSANINIPSCSPCPSEDHALSTITNADMCKLIKELKEENKDLKEKLATKENTNPNPNPRYRRNARKGWFYCWTHGANRTHSSKDCHQNSREQGHQEDATHANRKGGSICKCFDPAAKAYFS